MPWLQQRVILWGCFASALCREHILVRYLFGGFCRICTSLRRWIRNQHDFPRDHREECCSYDGTDAGFLLMWRHLHCAAVLKWCFAKGRVRADGSLWGWVRLSCFAVLRKVFRQGSGVCDCQPMVFKNVRNIKLVASSTEMLSPKPASCVRVKKTMLDALAATGR